jgi:hypothetical protein
MLGRERRQERRERREGGDATRYQMHQRMISIGDDYVIENDRGERVFKLDGKALFPSDGSGCGTPMVSKWLQARTTS